MGVPEKIKRIEEEMSKTQVNKNTEHHLGILRAKIAKLKREQEEARDRGKSSSSTGYSVKKSGDGTVAIIGLPNVGKSTLLNRLTGSKSKVGAYKFTTLTVVPGIMEYKGASIQILDLPGIIEQASKGKGLGKRILSVARSADLILLMIDVFQPEVHPVLIKELQGIGIRPDEKPPKTIIEKTRTGGVAVTSLVELTKISPKLVRDILHVYKIHNARVIIKEDLSADQLIDIILGNRRYVDTLTYINKVDLVNTGFIREIESRLDCEFIPISADADLNLDALKEQIYQRLDFIRIYLRPKGGQADRIEPLIVRNGSLVQDVCDKLHRAMKQELRYAQIWGNSAKFGGQRVGLSHTLMDEDIVTIIKR
jgi:ribosome-interacting GTPase 1